MKSQIGAYKHNSYWRPVWIELLLDILKTTPGEILSDMLKQLFSGFYQYENNLLRCARVCFVWATSVTILLMQNVLPYSDFVFLINVALIILDFGAHHFLVSILNLLLGYFQYFSLSNRPPLTPIRCTSLNFIFFVWPCGCICLTHCLTHCFNIYVSQTTAPSVCWPGFVLISRYRTSITDHFTAKQSHVWEQSGSIYYHGNVFMFWWKSMATIIAVNVPQSHESSKSKHLGQKMSVCFITLWLSGWLRGQHQKW